MPWGLNNTTVVVDGPACEGLECNHGTTYCSLLLHVSRSVNLHFHRGNVGLVVGVSLGLLALFVFTPLLGRRGASVVVCWRWISPFLLREMRGLTFPFYCRYFVCDMGLVWAAPTATVELGQNGLLDCVELHVRHWGACLHIIGCNVIPFIWDGTQQNHSLFISWNGGIVCWKALKMGLEAGDVLSGWTYQPWSG